jgi:DNA-binding NtrC family response regulator
MKESRPTAFNILAVDHDPNSLDTIRSILSLDDFKILTATDPTAGVELFAKVRPEVVLLALMFPTISGLEVLQKILAIDPGADVILVTADYSTDSAVLAIQKGACDYLTKPVDSEKLRQRILALRAEAERRNRTLQLDQELLHHYQVAGIIGRSPVMLDLFAKIRRIAPHFRTVLVTGATGTGKELVARALHQLSPVSSGPFAVCNSSALVESLAESELFGHVKGAFTGATQDKVGLFEYAHGGTLFLDEVGDMSLPTQAKLLRVLQNHEVQRVGSPATRKVEVNVIAATHRDLYSRVKEEIFREDLYYRLSMVQIELPRLAERREDLPLLERHFIAEFATQYHKEVRGMTRRAQASLARYSWPGNVRELENAIGHACMLAQGNVIDLADLPEYLRDGSPAEHLHNGSRGLGSGDAGLLSFKELERRHLLHVLNLVGGNKARAAAVLGVCRATVHEMLSKIEGEKKVTPS